MVPNDNNLIIFVLSSGEKLVALIHSFDSTRVVLVNPYIILSHLNFHGTDDCTIITKLVPWLPYQADPMEPHMIRRSDIITFVQADSILTDMYLSKIGS